jgi:hypothetical protein
MALADGLLAFDGLVARIERTAWDLRGLGERWLALGEVLRDDCEALADDFGALLDEVERWPGTLGARDARRVAARRDRVELPATRDRVGVRPDRRRRARASNGSTRATRGASPTPARVTAAAC